MDAKVEKKKKTKARARSEHRMSVTKCLAASPPKLSNEKRKKKSRTAPRLAATSDITKPRRDIHPPQSSPTIPHASSSPSKLRRRAAPGATGPPKKPRRRAKPRSPPRAEPAPPDNLARLSPNIRNVSRYIGPAYDAWVSTTPAAVMRQVQRIKEENTVRNRVSPERSAVTAARPKPLRKAVR